MTKNQQETLFVVYDGDCPFCSAYVQMARLREVFSKVELVSARDRHHIAVRDLEARGVDLNNGMAVVNGERLYYGPAAMRYISSVTTRSKLLNKLVAAVMANEAIAGIVYPMLNMGRKTVLFVLGRKQI
jgi:predicted DCC family thiol-disulfide oxidoreductase YuxK